LRKKAEAVSFHNSPIQIFFCTTMHLMVYAIASVAATFSVIAFALVAVAAYVACVLKKTLIHFLTIINYRSQAPSLVAARGTPVSRIIISL
jgi:hypothetical protein